MARAQAAVPPGLARCVSQICEQDGLRRQRLITVSGEATWDASTDVTPEHTGRRIGAEEAKAAFVGSTYVIEKARRFLEHTNVLDALSVRQLKMILLCASGAPGWKPCLNTKRS